MFTGLIEEIGEIVESRSGALRIRARTVLEGTKLGDSISVNGVCLTVTNLDSHTFTVGISPETWRRTNLRELKTSSEVNLERAVMAGQRLGGHYVQGHVDGIAEIKSCKPDGDALIIQITPAQDLLRYIVEKGFITVDGASLTVVNVNEYNFSISLISYSQQFVTLPQRRPHDKVNLEVDVLAKYVEKQLGLEIIKGTSKGATEPGLNRETLAKYGFLK